MEKHCSSGPMSIIYWNTVMMFFTLYQKNLAMASKSIEVFSAWPLCHFFKLTRDKKKFLILIAQ